MNGGWNDDNDNNLSGLGAMEGGIEEGGKGGEKARQDLSADESKSSAESPTYSREQNLAEQRRQRPRRRDAQFLT